MIQFLIAISQLLNTFHGGSAYEMLSSRAWRLRNEPYWKQLRFVLDEYIFFWWADDYRQHCQWCYESEQERCKKLTE